MRGNADAAGSYHERREGMKGSRIFILVIVAFLAVMFMVQLSLGKKFVWQPTFSHTDKQPFGAYVFDTIMASTMKQGYTVTQKTFYQLEHQYSHRRQGYLMVSQNGSLTRTEALSILRMAERGDKVMLAVSGYELGKITDTLNLSVGYEQFDFQRLKDNVIERENSDTIQWTGDDKRYTRAQYYINSALSGSCVSLDTIPTEVLGMQTGNDEEDTPCSYIMAASMKWGKGSIILIPTPLLFTNYSILEPSSTYYVHRLMSQFGALPVVRVERQTEEDSAMQTSPLTYFLSQPPLQWGICLSLLLIIVFMVFTARRKQRIIPVISPPKNRSLDFIKLIGTLYHRQDMHTDLVRKKYIYFSEEIRKQLGIDINDTDADARNMRILSAQTGKDAETLHEEIRQLRFIAHFDHEIALKEMKEYIDQMNEIINKL